MRNILRLDEDQCTVLEGYGNALLEHVRTYDPDATLIHNQDFLARLQFWITICSPELEQRLGELGSPFDETGSHSQEGYSLKFYTLPKSQIGCCESVSLGVGHLNLKKVLAETFNLTFEQQHWPNVRYFGCLYSQQIQKHALAQILCRDHTFDDKFMESLEEGDVWVTPLLTALFTEVLLYDDPINSRKNLVMDDYLIKEKVV